MKCNYCGTDTELVKGLTVYPHRPDLADKNFIMCFHCKAWVGCHPNTTEPMGSLANAELRKWRGLAHIAFDRHWNYPGAKTSRSRRRGKAYRWLAHRMGITKEQCHIGMFNIDQCKQVCAICKPKRKGEKKFDGRTRAEIRGVLGKT